MKKFIFTARNLLINFFEMPVLSLCKLLKVLEENDKISTLYLLKTADWKSWITSQSDAFHKKSNTKIFLGK